MIRLSTGLADAMVGDQGMRSAFENEGMVLNIYAGTPPASADAELAGAALLVQISGGGTGNDLSFEGPVNGVLLKDSNQQWLGTVAVDGTPTFYRLQGQGDSGGASNTAIRVQGTVGIAGDLKLGTTSLVAANPQSIDYYQLRLPLAYGA